jgi:hypothetical protein
MTHGNRSPQEKTRLQVVDFLRREVLGPTDGEQEVLLDPPNRRYLIGTLYPRASISDANTESTGLQSDLENESDPLIRAGVQEKDTATEAAMESSTQFLPSSLGLSFFTSADQISISVSAARYETLEGDVAAAAIVEGGGPTSASGRAWRRLGTMAVTVEASAGIEARPVFDNARGLVDVRWRSYPHGNLVTVTLSNAKECADGEQSDRLWNDMLFQAEMSVRVADGEFLEYPSVASLGRDEEEDELSLQYANVKTYAIGHSTSATWRVADSVDCITADALPIALVAGTLTKLDADENVDALAFDTTAMADLAADRTQICNALATLTDSYETWMTRAADLSVQSHGVSQSTALARERIHARINSAVERMARGVAILRNDDATWLAFQLANRAMILQYQHGLPEAAGKRRPLNEPADLDRDTSQGRPWHPFQIGFFLSVLEGLVDSDSDYRKVVDLIWFPTGGGKTEAYLLAAAFEIFRRRLIDGERGGGTAILSRYTLSLLTAQQFQRAAGTILACESIRRGRSDIGDRPISIGLWVGQATTPNKYEDAWKLFDTQRHQIEHEDVFILDRCPWCGTEIMPRSHSTDDAVYGIKATRTTFSIECPREDCPFSRGIPVHVVDDALYENVPTFVLGTVDKFADLAWESRGGAFFGNGGQFDPPSLIIQDELHLLTGPLGTTVGVYEHAIELVCEKDGRPPKVIASTATVRRANDQVNGLFARDVSVFPPPGFDESDSYFARKDSTGSGRMYVGIMPQGHTSDTATVHLLTALLQAPISLELKEDLQDLFWTVVAYHGSLQELGRTVTIARDEVPSRLESHFGKPQRMLAGSDVEELTANVDRSRQPRLLEQLSTAAGLPGSISVLAATNMLSVGVDVPRLGLMLINGQPKGTSEYIQATSRVGRSRPGLVVSVFRSTRPRDRSHYEGFTSYHSALYRHVEPTSVTPYSGPSQARNLHAALVILARHRFGLPLNSDAALAFPDYEVELRQCVDLLVSAVARVDAREASSARLLLERMLTEWKDKTETQTGLGYANYAKIPGPRLLREFSQAGDAWPTLRSMRNVDNQSPLFVLGQSKGRKK